jgi:hypothetical protein
MQNLKNLRRQTRQNRWFKRHRLNTDLRRSERKKPDEHAMLVSRRRSRQDSGMDEGRWQKITGGKLAGFGVGLVAFLWLLFASERGFIFGLDHANLLFHEAGHPIIGLVSTRLETYGGTIGQLTFPVLLAISFWRKGQALSFAASVVWFFQNWLNISRYMADARALELPLVGGGDHDWNTIFTRWDVLQYDLDIARGVNGIGWAGMAAAVLWVGWRWWNDRKRPQADWKPADFS